MGTSVLRVAKVRIVAGDWLKVAAGKLLYLGKGFRVILGEGVSIDIGGGHLFEPWLRCASWRTSEPGAGGRCLHDESCRVMVVESVRIGADALFGSSVQVCEYGHNHKFYRGRGCSELRHVPISIGRRRWLYANAVVTGGCINADLTLVSANSVAMRDLPEEGALYAGAPARLIKRCD